MQESEEFITPSAFADMMHGQVHPVIISRESEDEYYSHHGVGTAFVLEYAGEIFVVTAQHVLNAQNATHDDLRILLRNAPISVIFDQRAVFRDEHDPDPDSDLAIFRVVRSQHAALLQAGLTTLDAENCVEDADMDAVDTFHIFGYPDVGRGYDYEEKSLEGDLRCLSGQLVDPALPGLMSIKIQGERPEKFRGMSGSVIIADIDDIWKFAGMVTLASDPKGILSFIPAEKIAFYLNKMVLMEMTGMLLPEQPGNLP